LIGTYEDWTTYQKENKLLILEYSTIFEYMLLLNVTAMQLGAFGKNALFYLAAAVSDFYVPWDKLSDHKIQSGSGPLQLQLEQVPKVLGVLRNVWVTDAFLCGFKLETDPNLLLTKAYQSLEGYNLNVVIANELATRKRKVTCCYLAGGGGSGKVAGANSGGIVAVDDSAILGEHSTAEGAVAAAARGAAGVASVGRAKTDILMSPRFLCIEEPLVAFVAAEHRNFRDGVDASREEHWRHRIFDPRRPLAATLLREENERVLLREGSGSKGEEAEARVKRKRVQGPHVGVPVRGKDGLKAGIDGVEIPKRAKTAYLFFCEARRGKLKRENPQWSMVEITRELGSIWKGMPEAEKKEFQDQSQQDNVRFQQESEQYLSKLRRRTQERAAQGTRLPKS